jgi:hypothetical protein
MSLPNKSDVKNHLSTRRSKNLLPFRQANPPSMNRSGVELSNESQNMPSSRRESGRGPSPVIPISSIDALIGSDTATSAIKKPQA